MVRSTDKASPICTMAHPSFDLRNFIYKILNKQFSHILGCTGSTGQKSCMLPYVTNRTGTRNNGMRENRQQREKTQVLISHAAHTLFIQLDHEAKNLKLCLYVYVVSSILNSGKDKGFAGIVSALVFLIAETRNLVAGQTLNEQT